MPKPPDDGYVPALGYHWLTPLYDVVVRATTRERRFKQALIQQADFGPGQRVLDLATGTGTLAMWIKQSHPFVDVIGVDVDPAILARAIRKARAASADVRFDCAGTLSCAEAAQRTARRRLGRPANFVMRGLCLVIQWLDGFETTRDNAAGRLASLFEGTGFADVAERQTIGTLFGTLALYRAVKPLS